MIKYSFHNHTYRCGHAKICLDEEYIKTYHKMNFKEIGFADHMPLTKMQLPDERNKMFIKEFYNYKKKINKLKKKYKNMKILIGLECEYSDILLPHLLFLKKNCDYLILGQHYVKDISAINNVDYPILYAKEVCKAISTGLFDYIAHPDLFLKYRDTINHNDKKIYEQNCIKAIKMICEKASKLNIPLEINLSYINNTSIMKDDNYPYPHPMFFNISCNYDINYIWGIDAHNPKDILKSQDSINKCKKYIPDNLNILSDYNPINYRREYKNLDKLYTKIKSKIQSYNLSFKHFIKYNTTYEQVKLSLNDFKTENNDKAKNLINTLLKEINLIENSIMDINEKKQLIKRKKLYIKYTKQSNKFINKKLKLINLSINKLHQKYQGKDLIRQLKNITINLNR